MTIPYLKLSSRDSDDAGTVLVNGSTVTGYGWTSDGIDVGVLGLPEWDALYSSSIDSAPTMVGETPQSRPFTIPLLVASTTQTGLALLLRALSQQIVKVRRSGGGTLRFKAAGLNNYVDIDVQYVALGKGLWSHAAESFYRQRVELQFTAKPDLLPAPVAVTDTFATNTLTTGGLYAIGASDWTKISGNGSFTIASGVATTATTTGATLYEHTGTGWNRTDAHVQAKIRISSVTGNPAVGVLLKYVDGNNYIYAHAIGTGAGAGTIDLRNVLAGVDSSMASAAITTFAANTDYWITARIEGNEVAAAFWATEPTPTSTPTHGATDVMTTAEAAALGRGVSDGQGIRFNTGGTAAITYDDFKIVPHMYRNKTFPDVVKLGGSMEGDMGSRCDVSFTGNATAGAAPIWMAYGWMPEPPAYNYVHNYGFETDTGGWVATAVAGVTAAATSITRITTAFYEGSACAQIVCPATTDTGGSFKIQSPDVGGRFRAGVPYTAEAYLKSVAGVTVARLKLGVSGDIATGPSVALTSSWTRHTVTWTPTVDVGGGYIVAGIAAATGTTFEVDQMMVYEGTTAPTTPLGGQMPFGIIEAEAADTIGTEWTLTTDADYRSSTSLQGAAVISSGQGHADYYILPFLMTPDDYSDEVTIDVFGRVELASTQADVKVILSAAPEGGTSFGARRYAQPGARVGVPVAVPTATGFRPGYLGTIRLPVRRAYPVRWKLRVDVSTASTATGVIGLDYFVFLPSRRKVSSITGVDSLTQFASFIESTTETTKVVRWNGDAGTIQAASTVSRNEFPSADIGGADIILPAGAHRFVVFPSSYVPDRQDANSASMGEEQLGTFQVSPQPLLDMVRAN